MPTNPAKQKLRAARRKARQCVHCGKPAIVKDGKTLSRCQDCTDRDHENRKGYAARDEALGICRNTGCSNPVEPGRKHCPECNKKSGNRTTARKQGRTAEGKCVTCNNPPLPGITRCNDCNEKLKQSVKALQERRIAEGFCGRCGKNPVAGEGYVACQVCIDERRAWHAALKKKILDAYGGPICVGCGEDCFEVLQIDHIDGGGHKHALQLGDGNCARGRGKMYAHLRDQGFPPGFRVLCPTCNIKAARGIPLPNQDFLDAREAAAAAHEYHLMVCGTCKRNAVLAGSMPELRVSPRHTP